jgi:hypothetical protein
MLSRATLPYQILSHFGNEFALGRTSAYSLKLVWQRLQMRTTVAQNLATNVETENLETDGTPSSDCIGVSGFLDLDARSVLRFAAATVNAQWPDAAAGPLHVERRRSNR